jgi:hypothetical protein
MSGLEAFILGGKFQPPKNCQFQKLFGRDLRLFVLAHLEYLTIYAKLAKEGSSNRFNLAFRSQFGFTQKCRRRYKSFSGNQ